MPSDADPSPSAMAVAMYPHRPHRSRTRSPRRRRRGRGARVAAARTCDPVALPPTQPVDAAALGAKPAAVDWPREDWWHRYDDAQLDALIAEGLAGSPSLAAARARIARADAAAGVARAALLPQVNGNADVDLPALFGELHLPAAVRRQLEDRQPADARLQLRVRFLEQERRGARARRCRRRRPPRPTRKRRASCSTTNIARAYFNLQRLFAQRDVSRAAIAQREDVVPHHHASASPPGSTPRSK